MIKAKQKTEGIYLKSSITVHVFSRALEHHTGKNVWLFCTALGLTNICLPLTETHDNTVRGLDSTAKNAFHAVLPPFNTAPRYDALNKAFKFKRFKTLRSMKVLKNSSNLILKVHETQSAKNYHCQGVIMRSSKTFCSVLTVREKLQTAQNVTANKSEELTALKHINTPGFYINGRISSLTFDRQRAKLMLRSHGFMQVADGR